MRTDTIEQAIKLRNELIGMTIAGGFTPHKSMLNDLLIVQSLLETLIEKNLLNEGLDMKALGIRWDIEKYQFEYKILDEFN
jgi:hypothetical protein